MTINELAERAGMTARNIRVWQTQGLLPPPERRGRIGFYTDNHLARIERIKALRGEGLRLDVIRRMLDSSAESAAGVSRLVVEMLGPSSHSGPAEMKRVELARRLGHDAEEHLAACGLIEKRDDELVLVSDVVTLGHVESLVEIGLSLEEVASAVRDIARHHVASVEILADLYRERVWKPFLDAGLPSEQWQAIAEKTSRLRPAVIGVGQQAFLRALDEVVGKAAIEESTRVEGNG
ncbi:MerR family transcriptional regulator [Rhodococcus erythropolis]|uniref:MerR family transcriptional regulator n=1 Tax=Rhodococcus erythropolis TaxID=1833 RepID=UPI001C9AB700|nr:MerR family transcriptional regulator [Rhodococcus erythropolis]MBY6388853.1 MerR family transcriptional regulator [Rhodococcus erythropolis]